MKTEKAKVKIKVVVKAKHIRLGKPSQPDKCPIALALREMGYKKAECGLVAAQIGKYMYRLPPQVQNFVLTFDNFAYRRNYKIVPIQFILDEVLV